MGKIRILAIEDNALHASRLEFLLDELGYELISIAKNAEEALRLFKATTPDLILMDIDLSGEQEDGIQIAEKINTIDPVPIIFITASNDKETFKRAKATEPYAYMSKPIEQSALQTSIELAVFHFAKGYFKEAMEESDFSGWSGMQTKDCFFVKTATCLEKVRFKNVLWINVASDRYCEIVTEDKSYKIRASLKSLQEKLPSNFLRVHRTHIANIQKVDKINEQELTLTIADLTIPMGQANKQMIVQKFMVL